MPVRQLKITLITRVVELGVLLAESPLEGTEITDGLRAPSTVMGAECERKFLIAQFTRLPVVELLFCGYHICQRELIKCFSFSDIFGWFDPGVLWSGQSQTSSALDDGLERVGAEHDRLRKVAKLVLGGGFPWEHEAGSG